MTVALPLLPPEAFLPHSNRVRIIPIIGLPVAATDYAGAVEWILEHAPQTDRAYAVEAANTHVAALARTTRPSERPWAASI